MFQHRFNSGSLLIIDNLEGFKALLTSILPTEEIRILVDTSVARTVVLPPVSLFPVKNVKITVADVTGNAATNNVTVVCSGSDVINGLSSYIIASDFGSSRFETFEDSSYSVLYGAGGGGGGGNAILSYDTTLSAQQVLTLLNDPNAYIEALPSPESESRMIIPITCNFMIYWSGIKYQGGGASPSLVLTSVAGESKDFLFRSPVNILAEDYTGATYPNNAFTGLRNTGGFGGGTPAGNAPNIGGLYISSLQNYGTTDGNSPVRVFGTYFIKNL